MSSCTYYFDSIVMHIAKLTMFKNSTTHAALQLGKFIVRFGCVDMLEHLTFLFEKNIMDWTSYLAVVNYNMSLHVFFSLKNYE